MANRFKLRNFDDHHNNFTLVDSPDRLKRSMIESNRIYDRNAGVTHRFIHLPDDSVRLVSDVELIMSNDPYISSFTPRELKDNLYRQLTSSRSSSKSPQLSDTELYQSVPSNFGLELSDSISLIKSSLDKFDVSEDSDISEATLPNDV